MPIFHHAAPLAPTTLHVCTLPNLPPSVRLVGASTSTLQVGVALGGYVSFSAILAFLALVASVAANTMALRRVVIALIANTSAAAGR